MIHRVLEMIVAGDKPMMAKHVGIMATPVAPKP
jgi:hypothetical protein